MLATAVVAMTIGVVMAVAFVGGLSVVAVLVRPLLGVASAGKAGPDAELLTRNAESKLVLAPITTAPYIATPPQHCVPSVTILSTRPEHHLRWRCHPTATSRSCCTVHRPQLRWKAEAEVGSRGPAESESPDHAVVLRPVIVRRQDGLESDAHSLRALCMLCAPQGSVCGICKVVALTADGIRSVAKAAFQASTIRTHRCVAKQGPVTKSLEKDAYALRPTV